MSVCAMDSYLPCVPVVLQPPIGFTPDDGNYEPPHKAQCTIVPDHERTLLNEIERAIRARGWSARQTSMEAVGNPDMIRGMRRGRSPTADRLRALCEVLDLEFYVGRRREPDPLDERRLELAVETAERGLAASRRTLTHAEKARFFVAVYQLIGEEHAPANAARVRQVLRMMTEGEPYPSTQAVCEATKLRG